MKLFILIIHRDDYIQVDNESVCIGTETFGGAFTTKELADKAILEVNYAESTDIIECDSDKLYSFGVSQ